MRRKPVMFLSALALVSMGLTGCGGDADGNGDAAEPTTATEEATTQEEPTSSEPETQSPEEEDSADSLRGAPTDSAADYAATVDDIDAPDPGPAPEGAVIPAAAVAKPPQAIGPFSVGESSGPAHMYSDDVSSLMISLDSNILGSPYEQLVEYIETDNTPAGTGSCGTNESGSAITCYQRVDGGVVTMTAIPEEIPLEDMVVFVNHFAEQAGAA
ncbi:hypothetical protein V2J52_04425 [Georgenia sp. MJ173]|uniref:hypothetical protein n=1 Tax=Georgenia sunbinii TaxID=3117728 RepID=UPI002F26ABFA